jgi:hypothetical protein
LFVESANGNVGIGTSTPSNQFVVKTADGAGIAVENAAGNQYRWAVNSDDTFSLVDTGTAERMRIDSSGNVGIGTSSPSQKLDVNGTIIASTIASQGARIERNGSTGGANFDSVLSSGSLHFRTGSTEHMRIDSSGNVGIGTNAPTVGLELSGAGNATRIKLINGSDQVNFGLWDNSNYRLEGDANRKILITSYHTDGIHLGGSGSSDLVVKGNKVGIGTSSPSTPLHLQSSGQDANARFQAADNGYAARLQLYANNVSGASYNAIQSYVNGDSTVQWEISGPKASAEDQMLFHTGGVEVVRVQTGGLTLSPATSNLYTTSGALSYYGTTNNVYLNGASSGGLIMSGNGNRYQYVYLNSASDSVMITTNTVERLGIDSSGRVTMPYQPCCFAYNSGNGNSTGATGSGVLNVAGTNVGNHFNSSTGRFTCPVAGNYLVNWYAMNSQGNTGTVTGVLRVNGVGYSYFHIENSHPQSCSQQVVYSASAGDYFDLSISNFHFNGGSTYKYPGMSVVLIG